MELSDEEEKDGDGSKGEQGVSFAAGKVKWNARKGSTRRGVAGTLRYPRKISPHKHIGCRVYCEWFGNTGFRHSGTLNPLEKIKS